MGREPPRQQSTVGDVPNTRRLRRGPTVAMRVAIAYWIEPDRGVMFLSLDREAAALPVSRETYDRVNRVGQVHDV